MGGFTPSSTGLSPIVRRAALLAAIAVTVLASMLAAAAPASAACPSPNGDAYSTAVLADGPIAYYRLDETSGPTMCDSSSQANNGTYNGSNVTYGVPGALLSSSDTAVAADGMPSTPGVIGTSNSNSPISGNESFTLEGWFRSTGTTQNQALVDIGQAGTANAAGLAVWPTAGSCDANGSSIAVDQYNGNNCWDTTTVGVNLFDQNWHYLAVTYDATTGTVTAYVDGQSLGGQLAVNSPLNLAASPVRVGNWVDQIINQPYIGDADEVAVYPTALSAARIAAHYAAAESGPSTTPPPGTTTTTTTTTTPPSTPTTTTTTTSTNPPAVTSNAPSVQSSTAASFSGSVNPQGLSTTAYFQYGLDPSYTGGGPVLYTNQVTAQPYPVGSDFTAHFVSASVPGPGAPALVPNALYHVRLVAVSSAGTVYGPDQTFRTAKDPSPRNPVLGRSFNAVPVSGLVYVRLPGSRSVTLPGPLRTGPGFVPLTEVRNLPSGTEIDARAGTIKLITASGNRGKLQSGTFNGGIFSVKQGRFGHNKGLVTLKLLEGLFAGAPSYASCKARTAEAGPPVARIAVSGSVLSTLHAHSRGSYSSSGHYGSATSRGTAWTVSDRCDGTLITVQKDVVVVRDFVRHTTITLHAGQHYLAKP